METVSEIVLERKRSSNSIIVARTLLALLKPTIRKMFEVEVVFRTQKADEELKSECIRVFNDDFLKKFLKGVTGYGDLKDDEIEPFKQALKQFFYEQIKVTPNEYSGKDTTVKFSTSSIEKLYEQWFLMVENLRNPKVSIGLSPEDLDKEQKQDGSYEEITVNDFFDDKDSFPLLDGSPPTPPSDTQISN